MDAHRWQHIKAIFNQAVDLPVQAQSPFLESACQGDLELQREVEQLLVHHHQAEAFIEASAIEMTAQVVATQLNPALNGRVIGAYRVVCELGQGGMGAVYLAVRADDQFQKQVAIKLIQAGLHTEQSIRRFRRERQILAGLDHPHIARLLDGGVTEQGLPYLVMEFVAGLPLTEYCRQHQPTLRERLRLFCDVCAAVQFAHQHLTVHRDLKPGNILVTAEGTAKLLDFGIAKLLDEPVETDGEPSTPASTGLMMTPEYASPEQIRNEPVTTASDVYSLGVVLYELLTDQRPFQISRSASPLEIAQVICDSEPPAPSRQKPSIAGDLENVILKALQKEPSRRYASVEQFSEDIRRYLNGLPVLAHKDTFPYRISKFVRRHRGLVLSVSMAVLALVLGSGIALWQARLAREQERRALRRFEDVRQLANAVVFRYHDAIADLPGATPVREMLVKDALGYLDRLNQETGDDPALQRELATAYVKVGDVQGWEWTSNLGDSAGAFQSHQKALALRERLNRQFPNQVDLQTEVAESLGRVADLEQELGKLTEAYTRWTRAIAIREKMVAAQPASLQQQIGLCDAYVKCGSLLGNTGRANLGQAEAGLRLTQKALELAQDMVLRFPSRAEAQSNLVDVYLNHASLLASTSAIDQSLEFARKALTIQEKLVADDPGNVTKRHNLGYVSTKVADQLGERGRLDEAWTFQQKAFEIFQILSQQDPHNIGFLESYAGSMERLGQLKQLMERPAEARSWFERQFEVLQTLMKNYPADLTYRQDLATCHLSLAETHEALSAFPQAAKAYEQAIRLLEPLYTAQPENAQIQNSLALTCNNLGNLELKLNRPENALARYTRSFQLYQVLFDLSPGSNFARRCVAVEQFKMAAAHVKLAQQSSKAMGDQAQHWQVAGNLYQTSLDHFTKLQAENALPEYFASKPEELANELEICRRKFMESTEAEKKRAEKSKK